MSFQFNFHFGWAKRRAPRLTSAKAAPRRTEVELLLELRIFRMLAVTGRPVVELRRPDLRVNFECDAPSGERSNFVRGARLRL